eukprot:TRINITY_DN3561_c0_g3_i1.p1 TRINITY_DN3561_c0_g3~~TRINITY_DN3561_c0_g3_i1.p1  ORF type:complete len:189 (+),score=30.98 TRINITY_DN3561_c0_g3_i1:99-665(+)
MSSSSSTEVHLGDEPIPLQNSWTVWHDRNTGGSRAEYESNLKEVCQFDTVQKFWEYFNHLPTPDKLSNKAILHMMISGIKPLWEDPLNEKGGIWNVRVEKKDTVNVWKEIVLAAIGEQFAPILEEGDDINGVSVSPRMQHDIIQIWNRRSSPSGNEKIIQKVKKLMEKINIIDHFYAPCSSHSAFEKK